MKIGYFDEHVIDLYAGGWRAEDADELRERYGYTDDELANLVENLAELNEYLYNIDRWTLDFPYDEKICDATDAELLNWADEDETWNEFSLGCLHDLAWRHGLGWNLPGEYGMVEDGDQTIIRIRAELESREHWR